MPDYIDLGRKPSEVKPMSSSGNKSYYPSLYIDNKDINIEQADVGKIITAMVKLKVNSIEKRATKDKKTYSCSFDVLGINFNKKKMVDIKSASEFDLDQLEEEEFEVGKGKKKGGLYIK